MQATDQPPSRAARRRPILVTGSHRSGSTWVGNVLALAPGTGYIHEPFNRNCRDGTCRARFPTNFTYVTEANEAGYVGPLGDTLSWRYSPAAELRSLRRPADLARMARDIAYFAAMRRRRARAIMKDPLALFSAEWLARRFDMDVVVIIRHPAAFVASLIAAGWERFPFRILLDQPALMRDRLEPFRRDIEAAAETPPGAIEAGILLWLIIHHHIDRLQSDHPDWIFVRHEDLSGAPGPAFRELYGELGLAFTPRVERGIQTHSERRKGRLNLSLYKTSRQTVRSSREAMKLFKERLSREAVMEIYRKTQPIYDRYYDYADLSY